MLNNIFNAVKLILFACAIYVAYLWVNSTRYACNPSDEIVIDKWTQTSYRCKVVDLQK